MYINEIPERQRDMETAHVEAVCHFSGEDWEFAVL